MRGQLLKWFDQIRNSKLIALAAASAGGLLYFFQSRYAIFHLPSLLDEGLYLFKGLLFAQGSYQPYQDYGFWMNKLPFGYLLAGWLQQLFGAGIRAGRYLALVLGVMMLIGLWLTVRRLSGSHWWAAFALWTAALNPTLIQIYSKYLSEVLVAALLTWLMALTLGRGRKDWQLLAGSVLLGAILITRQNLIVLLPLWAAYEWIENGRRAGWITLVPAALMLIIVHGLYYPQIMEMWMPWVPEALRFLARPWLIDPGGMAAATPRIPLLTRVLAFWEGARVHFVSVAGALFAVFFWRRRAEAEPAETGAPPRQARDASYWLILFLIITFFLLFGLHFYAAIILDYCTYCFTLYTAFFSMMGLVLFILAAQRAERTRRRSAPLALITAAALTVGVFFGAWRKLEEPLMFLQVPRARGMRILPGTADLWQVLHYQLGLDFETLRVVVPTFAGVLAALLIFITGWLVYLQQREQNEKERISFAYLCFLLLLIAGTIALPTPLLGGEWPMPTGCGNVIENYEQIGAEAARQVEEGARVYYAADPSPLLMLYLPPAQIFPPQYELEYSQRIGGDPDLLLRYGYWNAESDAAWFAQADVVIVSERNLRRGMSDRLAGDQFRLVYQSAPVYACQADSEILIFRREPD
ncbi:MAG: glycosyltransferase family 39 protein [Anaerolineaceae bacterium]|nr:glycosyltransferase family 39 protein [Anaerolineaceae bacterium]